MIDVPMGESWGKKTSWLFFALVTYSILRGVRSPNIWGYSHFLFNYQFGFIKRGLIGEVVRLTGIPQLATYEFFFIFSAIVFGINIFLLCWLAKDLVKQEQPFVTGVTLVFASSLSIVFLSHTIGYFDQIGLLIVLITLRLRTFQTRLVWIAIALPIGLFIHEATLVIFFPLLFMSLALKVNMAASRKQISIIAGISLLAFLLTFFLGNRNLTSERTDALFEMVQSQTDIPLRQDAFYVLERDSADNKRIVDDLWNEAPLLPLTIYSLVVTAPTFLIFIYFSVFVLRKAHVHWVLIFLTILGSLSPLVLNFIGWDIQRWFTLTGTTSFLMFCFVYFENYSEAKQTTYKMGRYTNLILAAVIFMNLAVEIPLFDEYEMHRFPFVAHFEYVSDLLSEKAYFFSPPQY